ncbi:aminotransferase class I/II-fold pyridoxal phosphate-dependent enzyme [Jatrophihabitans telluris]|uniref:Aminotransferase class I/II-fold pyridoxal phosphate-dependent enzyme n=1 Tax=Jatrophihabitans telluris TaxID=2038343 RepID=A0ABY4QV99_9ACTN|nr:aminotransferase class I/II-fold pyridoxal phosphate-dependent enzyme [Jatrophihabitans telluris]UQX86904.1 aminotransferase class I/II-fold pyridoxal phosphate-dependent enzyme [Jatrophihabitans telluris]
MAGLPDFKLETYFSRWEFAARHNLTASDLQTTTVSDLLAMAEPDERADWERLDLGYVETFGSPALREAIAQTYENVQAADVLSFTGAQEGIFWTLTALLDKGDHAVVVLPGYQSVETVAASRAEVTGVLLDEHDNWRLDVEAVAAALRPNTTVVAVNFPNNPTGAVADQNTWRALVELVRGRGIYLFSDEVYRGVELDPARTLAQAADLYERAISLNVMSKAYGLPGLRIGWIACRDRGLLSRVERLKHYGSICNAGPSEVLARIALKAAPTILARGRALLTQNAQLFGEFFARHDSLFRWEPPAGGCVCFPRYLGPGSVDEFCLSAVERSGVLLLPGSVYASALGPVPTERFRVGIGRAGAEQALRALDDHLNAIS